MSKLQILISQYQEDENTIKPLLDSIQFQQNIDLKNDIEVFIGNDGSDVKLSADFLKQYSYNIQYHCFKHERLAATRKKLFDLSTAEYIMYCDADDMFANNFALSIIFNYMDSGFDTLFCEFLAEIKLNNQITYAMGKVNPIFIHGKVYRRQFLVDNDIQWHAELYEHQDHAYNLLARICSQNHKQCDIPLYMWRYNPNSVSRKNGNKHEAITWPHLIDSTTCLIHDLLLRGYGEQAKYCAFFCLHSTYVQACDKIWQQENLNNYKQAMYSRIGQFYSEFYLLINNTPQKTKEHIINNQINLAKKRNLDLSNNITFDQWLQIIINSYT